MTPKAEEFKERTAETSFVMALHQPRRTYNSPDRTDNDAKRKTANAQNDAADSVRKTLTGGGARRAPSYFVSTDQPSAIRPPWQAAGVNKELPRR